MKITAPVVTVQQVGTSFTTVDYTDGRSPAAVVSPSRPVYRAQTGSVDVFDYDFHAAQRARGVGFLAHAALHLAVALPLFVIYTAGQKIGEGIEYVADKGNDLLRAHGVPTGSGIRATFANILNEIAAK